MVECLIHYCYLYLFQEAITNSELALQSHGRYAKYSSSKKAGVYNEVAMGALPALISMLPSQLVCTPTP